MEETPKEGDGNARESRGYRTATTYTATHKKQVLLTYFPLKRPANCAEQVFRIAWTEWGGAKGWR
jgi:hypothetical protein